MRLADSIRYKKIVERLVSGCLNRTPSRDPVTAPSLLCDYFIMFLRVVNFYCNFLHIFNIFYAV